MATTIKITMKYTKEIKNLKFSLQKNQLNINEESNSGNGICVWFHMEYYPG